MQTKQKAQCNNKHLSSISEESSNSSQIQYQNMQNTSWRLCNSNGETVKTPYSGVTMTNMTLEEYKNFRQNLLCESGDIIAERIASEEKVSNLKEQYHEQVCNETKKIKTHMQQKNERSYSI